MQGAIRKSRLDGFTRRRVRDRDRVLCAQEEEEEEDDKGGVMQVGTQIYFYSDVTTASVQSMLEKLQKANECALNASVPEVVLHIHSYGGDAFAGLAAYNIIRNNPLKVVTCVDSMAASAATFLLLAGERRIGMKHSFVLIHQVSTSFFGKYQDMVDEVHNTQDLMDTFRSIYSSHTKLEGERLESTLRGERAITASDCMELGIIHSIA